MLDPGQAIYYWRLKRNLTQSDLARETGIPQPNISRIEKGKLDITISTLKRIANALGVSPGVLLEVGRSQSEDKGVEWSRDALERVARHVIDPASPAGSAEKRLASLFSRVIPSRHSRYLAKREMYRSWLELRMILSPQELKNILSRIHKARRRKEIQTQRA